jgi:enamine deaminase RidA (YjgF/YER057c/UK114 family)
MLAPPGGRVLFVAGQTATDQSGTITTREFVGQVACALENILTVVREAGGRPEHIGRITFYVTDIEAYRASLKPLGKAYRGIMGRHYPAMALVEVKGLVDPEALVEIEATAVLP